MPSNPPSPRSATRRVAGALTMLLPWLALAPAADAQLVDPRVTAARCALGRYELRGEATFRTLSGLTAYLGEVAPGADAREARFLRAIAATDLWILAVRSRELDAVDRIAAALGVPEAELGPLLAAELATLRVGVYGEGALRASAAVRALRAMRDGGRVRFEGLDGSRRDALFVEAVYQALRGDAPVVPSLARLVPRDPCTDEASCPPTLAPFDGEGRRAVSVLQEVVAALDRLAERAEAGDPFARALAWSIPTDRVALDGLELAPAPWVDTGFELVASPGAAAYRGARALVEVGVDELRVGFVPRARLDARGEVEIVADGAPRLPEMASIPLPGDFRPIVLPVEELEGPLAALFGAPALGPRGVVVTVAEDVPAHVVSRVMLSLEVAGATELALFGRDAAGVARVVPVDLVRGDEAELRTARHVYVRLGGYLLTTRGRGVSSIPRVRDPQGFRFDVETLASATADAPGADGRSLAFMGIVGSGTVAEAAFALSHGHPVRWLVQ